MHGLFFFHGFPRLLKLAPDHYKAQEMCKRAVKENP